PMDGLKSECLDGFRLDEVDGFVGILMRRRRLTPVSHQVRLFYQLRPASCRLRQIVNVLTLGSPSDSWRRAFCSRLKDQLALPSASRSGARTHSAGMRMCASAP
ncbi:hypothetical protein, partial [Microvirga arvi]|uniref:hypothetical protein n=1 Tax=Microvirga arvi TaxID=2778731 RepID=UPI001EF412EB